MKVKKNENFIANGIVVKNCDALRYCIASHKIAAYEPYAHNPAQYQQQRFGRQNNF